MDINWEQLHLSAKDVMQKAYALTQILKLEWLD
jgi:hypothetical protein